MAQSSSASSEFLNGSLVVCHCNRPTRIVKAWTDENPGRRFLKCRGQGRECKFFAWFDVEKPQGWQHIALLEAREVMREQKEEIERLKKLLIVKAVEDPSEVAKNGHILEESEALKRDVLVLQREVSVMRNVLALSWVGFTVVVGVTIALLK